ncbi:MAG: hypothetical protein HN352_13770 [Bacteroidetes bacterium]|nr:hypothetical protein [Bacteroidota bacterium]MBT4411966.1 hypothetical protein [Bacteroidota bacterium]MBT7464573.1 hypothetical protein [Bacteroidota bacterium]
MNSFKIILSVLILSFSGLHAQEVTFKKVDPIKNKFKGLITVKSKVSLYGTAGSINTEIQKVEPGTQLKRLSTQGDWVEVELDGTRGFVFFNWVSDYYDYYVADSIAKVRLEAKNRIKADRVNAKRNSILSNRFYVLDKNADIYPQPKPFGSMGKLEGGYVIDVIDYKDSYYGFLYEEDSAYVFYLNIISLSKAFAKKIELIVNDDKQRDEIIERNKDYIAGIDEAKQKNEQALIESENRIAAERKAMIEERARLLSDKYKNNKYLQSIIDKKIVIGMTKEMVLDSWGRPNSSSKDVGSWGIHEQMIYNSHYVYIENGFLTSWSTK